MVPHSQLSRFIAPIGRVNVSYIYGSLELYTDCILVDHQFVGLLSHLQILIHVGIESSLGLQAHNGTIINQPISVHQLEVS